VISRLVLTLGLAFVYALLGSAAIGLVLMVVDVKLDADRWGYSLPIALFLLLIVPAWIVAGKFPRNR
jgi:hypothetical protein